MRILPLLIVLGLLVFICGSCSCGYSLILESDGSGFLESPLDAGDGYTRDSLYTNEKHQAERERPEERDKCVPKKEVCNLIDDDCNGIVDDLAPVSCIPEGAKRVCSKGRYVCKDGKPSYCAHSVLPLSPSCLSKDDLDCDGKPDRARFGRMGAVAEKKLTTVFSVLSHIRFEQMTLLLIRQVLFDKTSLQLWGSGNGPFQPITVYEESSWHSELRSSLIISKLALTPKKKLFVGFCWGLQQKRRCFFSLVDPLKGTYQTLKLPALPETHLYSDFVFSDGHLALLALDKAEFGTNKNLLGSVTLYRLLEDKRAFVPVKLPPLLIRLEAKSAGFASILKEVRWLADGRLLLVSFAFVEEKERTSSVLNAHILHKQKWGKYTYSTEQASSIVGKGVLSGNVLRFPYRYSSQKIFTAKMDWSLTEIAFTLDSKRWVRKPPFIKVNGRLAIRGMVRESESAFVVAKTSCENKVESLTLYAFDAFGKKKGDYLVSTGAYPRDLVLERSGSNFFLAWLTGNQVACGARQVDNILHWAEFGDCK